jgi:hypothetical protein
MSLELASSSAVEFAVVFLFMPVALIGQPTPTTVRQIWDDGRRVREEVRCVDPRYFTTQTKPILIRGLKLHQTIEGDTHILSSLAWFPCVDDDPKKAQEDPILQILVYDRAAAIRVLWHGHVETLSVPGVPTLGRFEYGGDSFYFSGFTLDAGRKTAAPVVILRFRTKDWPAPNSCLELLAAMESRIGIRVVGLFEPGFTEAEMEEPEFPFDPSPADWYLQCAAGRCVRFNASNDDSHRPLKHSKVK